MLHRALVKGNCPVWIIFPNRRSDEETTRKLCIDGNLVVDVQFTGKSLFIVRIIDDVAVQAPICFHCVHTQFTTEVRTGKDTGIIGRVQLIISDMLNDLGRLLIVYQLSGFENKLLRVQTEHGEFLRRNALQNGSNSSTGQAGFFNQFSNQIIPNTAMSFNSKTS